jgi:DNA-binding response OmpR family regulator
LPVVIMSAERGEETVRAAIRLGIQGYLAKPIDVTVVAAKLESIVQTAAARPDHSARRDSAVDPNGKFLVVDGSDDFRQMFASAFSIERPVVEAATGVEALVQAASTSPTAIFVGSDVGLLAGRLLIRKLRSHGNLQQTRIVAIQSTHSSEPLPGVHATIVRSVGPESLRAQVESIDWPSSPDKSFAVPQE